MADEIVEAIENRENAAQAAIAVAEAKAEAADELNEQLTEAALRDKLGQRVDDVEEGIEEWQSELEELQHETQSLQIEVRLARETIANLQGQLTALLSHPLLIQPPPKAEPSPPSPTSTETETPTGETKEPPSASEDGQKVPARKNTHRLI